MPTTVSARKANRLIARRTEVNKGQRGRVRTAVRKVEEAIKAGDRQRALNAMKEAEPELMRAARRGLVHKNAASRKVARLTKSIAKLAK